MFKGPSGFILLFNILLNLLLGVVLTIVLLLIVGNQMGVGAAVLTPLNIFTATLVPFFVGMFFGFVWPGIQIGVKLAQKLHCGPGATYVLMCVIMGLGMGFFISLFAGWITNVDGMNPASIAGALDFYKHFTPLLMGSAAVLATIFIKPFSKLVAKVAGCNPLFDPPADAPQA